MTALFQFDNSYARLPERFYARLDPTPVAAPRLIRLNAALAEALGAAPDALRSADGVAALAGNRAMEGAAPLAMAYAGHQFGGWVPQLGDGRALLMGEVVARDGRRRDLQLKGSGPTPWSRMGDGRAPLGPALREYVVSEAMHALGVPTTRALAVLATGEPVAREAVLAGGVIARVAASHIRVGTFQYFAARQDHEALTMLTDHALARHYPGVGSGEYPALALLTGVIERQAKLVAKWMNLGFVHGVMNTDNMTISGETIDYGPCAFIDGFDPEKKFSSIDQHGRYAFHMQPKIAHWNLAQLAIALVPLIGDDEAAAVERVKQALDAFPAAFEAAWLAGARARLGLIAPGEGDRMLAEDLHARMAAAKADFTNTFRALADAAEGDDGAMRVHLGDAAAEWLATWRHRLAAEGATGAQRAEAIRAASPAYIPRNHLVEQAIAAAYADDFAPFHQLCDVLERPYEAQKGAERHAAPPAPEEEVEATFCGT